MDIEKLEQQLRKEFGVFGKIPNETEHADLVEYALSVIPAVNKPDVRQAIQNTTNFIAGKAIVKILMLENQLKAERALVAHVREKLSAIGLLLEAVCGK